MKATITKPMQLVHSALNPNSKNKTGDFSIIKSFVNSDIQLKAYQVTCEKYSKEIEAIQKYFPGWMPGFNLL